MQYHFFAYNPKLWPLCYSWILLESRSNKQSFPNLYQILKVMLHYVYFVDYIISQTFVSFIFLDNLNFFLRKRKIFLFLNTSIIFQLLVFISFISFFLKFLSGVRWLSLNYYINSIFWFPHIFFFLNFHSHFFFSIYP